MKSALLFLVALALNLNALTIVVPKQVSSIQTALDKAENGDTIFVLKGIYREKLTIRENITLIGESESETVVQGNKRGPVIRVIDDATIRKLTIANGGIGILSENTNAAIEDNIIRDNKGSGIQCLISIPQIRNNVISNNDWCGIYCESARSIKSSIDHNIIAQNGYSGVMLGNKSEVLVQNNCFFDNKQYGIWVSDMAAKSRIIYNNFYANRTNYNIFAKVDKTNLYLDPEYPATSSQYNFLGETPIAMKGKGIDGSSIGIIPTIELEQITSDPDHDGIKGKEDLCPNIPEDIDGFEDSDGCPEFDNDNDGIYDTQDLCPNEAEDFDGYKDDDGCPDLDNDNDGIPDTKDVCPQNPEVKNGYKDDDGCPDEVPAGMNLKDSTKTEVNQK